MKVRHKRTVFIGVLATAVFAWAAIDRFDVPPEELAWLLLYCVIGVVAVALLAGICVGLLIGARRLLSRLRGEAD